MDELHDYGLVVAAVCFGLTPENILDHWEKIGITVAQEISPGVTVVYKRESLEARRRIGTLAVIIYLFERLRDLGIGISSLPDPVKEWVKFSITTLRIKPSSVPSFIEKYECLPNDKPNDGIKLYLEITPETTKDDIIRTWPQIEWHQYKLWGKQRNKPRIWRNYERDLFLWQKVNIDGLAHEKAYADWLDKNPNKYKTKDTSTIIKAVEKVEKLSRSTRF
ncbi:unnamed protein product [marine sediment metagenome]|uniref:Uncharacterized protein n=1 Tax=marine sediment metagenome TaxID=412755 RepID=X1B0V1_9ZZZZ